MDLDGAGEGGDVGGNGRMEASSSASGGLDQVEPGAAIDKDSDVDRGEGGSESALDTWVPFDGADTPTPLPLTFEGA